jgi:hypothetical protein
MISGNWRGGNNLSATPDLPYHAHMSLLKKLFETARRVIWRRGLSSANDSYGLTNFSVMRSDSPIARYLARSFWPSASVGGSVHTPSG